MPVNPPSPISGYQKFFWNRSIITLVLVFVSTRLLLWGAKIHYSDVAAFYHDTAFKILVDGLLPYRDFSHPYPPGALLWIVIPGLVSLDPAGYLTGYRALMLVFDALNLSLLYWLSLKRLRWSNSRSALACMVYCVCSLPLLHVIYDRLDLVLAFLFLVAAATYQSRSDRRSVGIYLIQGWGMATKFVPALWFPLQWVIEVFRFSDDQAGLKAIVKSTARAWMLFGIPAGTLMAFYYWASSTGSLQSLGDHTQRPIQIESIWAVPLYWMKLWNPGFDLSITNSYGALHMDGPGISRAYLALSKSLSWIALGGLYLGMGVWVRGETRAGREIRTLDYLRWMTCILLVFIVTCRVFSPQYLLWVLPGLSVECASRLASTERRWSGWVFGFAVGLMYLLTGLLFPYLLHELWEFKEGAVIVLTARNVLAIGITVSLGAGVMARARPRTKRRRAQELELGV